MAAGQVTQGHETGEAPDEPLYTPVKLAGLAGGALVLLVCLVTSPPEGLSAQGWAVLGVAGLMAIWWASEALPVPATALVPLAAFPLLDLRSFGAASAPYADPLVFLFLGGFLLARGLQRWTLHRRVALAIASNVGTRPDALVLGFMLATAFLSMWVSNTATAVMMVPIAASVIAVTGIGAEGSATRRDFGIAMMLGIAYAASIGGAGTLIGTPPNAFLAGYMGRELGVEVSFASWALVAMPVVAVLLPLAWLLLTRVICPACQGAEAQASGARGRDLVREALAAMGPLRTAEGRMAMIFIVVALAWVTRPLLVQLPGLGALTDSGIGMIGGLLLFILPAGKGVGERGQALLSWEEAVKLPWGVLLLFGGGLSLAGAIGGTDLADWFGDGLRRFEEWPLLLFVLIVTALVVFLTELTSNTATTATFLPILAALAVATGYAPMTLAVPAALAASCAFMLPVATPPNAVVFSSGYVTIAQMVRAGIVMNIVAIAVITVAAYWLVPLVFGR